MSIEDFTGVARLFPLPDLVMFPQVVQPLRIFEPRYVDMLHEALSTDRLIAMASLVPGWEQDNDENPAIHETVCIGQIMSEAQVADGSYNIFLAGLGRGVIREELPSDTLFRKAQVEVLNDIYEQDKASTATLQDELTSRFRALMPANESTDELLSRILSDECSLGMLVDVIAFALPLQPAVKLQLLSEPRVEVRARLLIERLSDSERRHREGSERVFPPDFSLN